MLISHWLQRNLNTQFEMNVYLNALLYWGLGVETMKKQEIKRE